jgi:hypothetical protein
MAALDTVSDYVTRARVLLNDTVAEYRYPDAAILAAMNLGLLEARRIRPDLFIGRSDAVPEYLVNDSTTVVFDAQYRVPLLYFIVGFTQLSDEEDTQDARAVSFVNKFTTQLAALG